MSMLRDCTSSKLAVSSPSTASSLVLVSGVSISTSASLRSGLGSVVTTCEIADFDCARCSQRDILPDAGVAVANSGNPVPALGRSKGRSIDHFDASVFSGPRFDGLLMRDAGMRRRTDAHRERILSGGRQDGSHIEFAAQKCARESAKLFAVEPDLGGVVHALERECQTLARAVAGVLNSTRYQ